DNSHIIRFAEGLDPDRVSEINQLYHTLYETNHSSRGGERMERFVELFIDLIFSNEFRALLPYFVPNNSDLSMVKKLFADRNIFSEEIRAIITKGKSTADSYNMTIEQRLLAKIYRNLLR